MAQAGQLTQESHAEQAQAHLDQLSAEEKARMCQLNNQYKAKFGVPFVICARLNKKEAILQGLQTRLNHTSVEAEVQIGIEQVLKISELRLKDIVH